METAKRILIIDDDIDFQLMMGNMLRTSGYEVKYQLEGETEAARKSAKECDMVLLDIGLPGVNGVTIGKALKSSPDTKHIPIILMSAQPESDQMFIDSRANAMFKKPFSMSGMVSKMNELLGMKKDTLRLT